MDEGPARVITLGRTPPRRSIGRRPFGGAQIQPQWTIDFMTPPTSPSMPQNLLRATLQNGPHALGYAAAQVVEDASLGNFGKVARMLGQGTDNGGTVEPNGEGAPTNQLGPPGNNRIAAGGAYAGNGKWRPLPPWMWVLSAGSSAASAWHGYRRNQSIGWAIWWAVMGGMFPLVTPAIGAAQGWGKRAR